MVLLTIIRVLSKYLCTLRIKLLRINDLGNYKGKGCFVNGISNALYNTSIIQILQMTFYKVVKT